MCSSWELQAVPVGPGVHWGNPDSNVNRWFKAKGYPLGSRTLWYLDPMG